MLIREFNGIYPEIDPLAYIVENAAIVGDVKIGPKVSIWYGASLRGDLLSISVDELSNIQDNCVIHTTFNGNGTKIGKYVTIGHGAILHDCVVNDYCLIGMNATLLDGAIIEKETLIGAGSVVTPNTVIPPGVLALGCPAVPVRDLTDSEKEDIIATARRYYMVAMSYRDGVPFDGNMVD